MSDWSNAEVLNFLEHYQEESCIWDPSNIDHKDRQKIADAWSRLSNSLNKSVKELKNKKEILMVTFRKHLKRKQESYNSGEGIDELYEPIWFAYELMESFLLPVYAVKSRLNSITHSNSNHEELFDESQWTCIDASLAGPSSFAASVYATPAKRGKRRRLAASDSAKQLMAAACRKLTNVLVQQQNEDLCDIYGKLIAEKMREIPEHERNMVMHKIDRIFLEKAKERTLPRRRYIIQNGSAMSIVSPDLNRASTDPFESLIFVMKDPFLF